MWLVDLIVALAVIQNCCDFNNRDLSCLSDSSWYFWSPHEIQNRSVNKFYHQVKGDRSKKRDLGLLNIEH